MAAATGFSHTTIRRMGTAFGLQPHRSQTFKLSSDPLFVDKVRDIVGLYLSPPNRALVLSIDEKSHIQALDREQPVLPMMPGVPERRTHSYVRHGTTSLFAALDVASGFVIGKCYKRHRAVEFLNFLKEVDAQVKGWRTFLRNHAPDIAAMDLFVIPTIGFELLYAFVIVR